MAAEWRDVLLGDLAAPIRNALVGGPFGSDLIAADYVASGVPVIRGENLSDGRWVGGEFVFVSPSKADQLSANTAGPLDIVFTQRGANHYRQVAVVSPGAEQRYVISQSQMKLTVDRNQADPLFVYYLFRAPQQQEYLQRHAIQTGVPHTNLSILRNVPLRVPPVQNQRAIAHILGTLDDKIELNRRRSETLEAMARALFKSWFVDFDPVRAKSEGRDPGLRKPLADLFPDSFEDSQLGEIPKAWKVGTLGDVAEHMRRGVRPGEINAQTPYIALEHMPRRCLSLADWRYGDGLESNKFEFKRGEILFGKLRPYFHKVGVAPVDGVCSTDIVVVRPKAQPWFGFVLGHTSSVEFVEYTNAGSTGTKMPRTSWTEMACYEVVLPPEPMAAAFSEMCQRAVDRIIEAIHESRTLAALRDALLPKLISGELHIEDAERFIGRRNSMQTDFSRLRRIESCRSA
jgi:type I restriction enzyme S subunit